MEREKVRLTGAQETMLATLYGRALDSRSANPLLGDPEAERAVERIDYDFDRLSKPRMARGIAFSVAVRARPFDRWLRRRLATHPDATVLHLGCGLDTRAFRVDPPETVRWYDVDYPEVIDLRNRVFPERAGVRTLASSVTDPHLLDDVPGDGPVFVAAEGLMMYLSERDGHDLLRRITEHFPSGELLFDAYSSLTIRASRLLNPIVRRAGARLGWGIDDPRELPRAVGGLRLESAPSFYDFPEMAHYPGPVRFLLPLLRHSYTFRRSARLLRYSFGTPPN